LSAVVGTARTIDPGLVVYPCTSERPEHSSAPSASTGPSQPDPTDFRGYFNIEPDTPAFKVPRLPPPRTYVTEMSTTIILRQTSQEAYMAQEHRPLSQSSVTSHTRSRLSTVYPRDRPSPHSSIEEWLQQVNPGAPPPTPTAVTSQAMFELPLGLTASATVPQRSRSLRYSCSHRTHGSRYSSRPLVAAEVFDFTSRVTENLF